MAEGSSDLSAIKLLLEQNQISHFNLLQFTTISPNKIISLDVVIELIENVDACNTLFSDATSTHYIADKYQRMDKLRQLSCQWLIKKKYDEFYINHDLPLAVECFIRNKNLLNTDINDILAERIRNAATQNEKCHQEIIDAITSKYYDKKKYYYRK